MKKLIIISFCLLFILTGCIKENKMNQDDDKERVYLTEKYYNKGNAIKVDETELSKLTNETFVVFTYNDYCSFTIPCDTIFEEFMDKYNIDFINIPFENFKNTSYYETVKFGPSILIIQNGKILAYLDANSDEDLAKYQDVNSFEKWMDNYIYFSKKQN